MNIKNLIPTMKIEKCVVVGAIGMMMCVLFALVAAHWRGIECSMFTVLQ